MDAKRLITIAFLLIIWDRVEFVYYMVERGDMKVGFLLMGNPIRLDSYVYFASIYLQQVIMAVIIYLLYPVNAAKYFVIACLLCFVEYFVTYGQPIAKIPLPWGLYIPISCSTVRLISVCYFMWVLVKKALNL